MFSTLEPTVFNSCEYWFNKDPAKIRHIRIDTLGQMMSLANVQPGGRYLVVDDTAGMVIATMLERIGGTSSICHSRTTGSSCLLFRPRTTARCYRC